MSGGTPIIKGSLTVKVHGLLKHKQLPGQWGVLFDSGGQGKPPRIELFQEKNDNSPVKVIHLERMKWVDKSYKHTEQPGFEISIKKEKHHFTVNSVDDKDDWVQSLCHVDENLWKQRAQDREISETEDSAEADEEIMSENLLYDSFDRAKQFKVSINTTKASEANNLKGHFYLMPTRDSLRLLDISGSKCIHEFPYRHIRKYGRTKKIYQMEVGRKCTTGEGSFSFFTPEGEMLVDLMNTFTQQMHAREQDGASEITGEHSPGATRATSAHISRRTSENTRTRDGNDSHQPQRGSSLSTGSRQESPKLSHRSYPPPVSQRSEALPVSQRSDSSPVSHKQNGVGARFSSTEMSPDNKIYETASGLTAPLASEFKNELHSKLNIQHEPNHGETVSHSADSTPQSAASASVFWTEHADQRPETEAEEIHSSEREKKRSDKESKENKKRREKEQKAAEAKAKKELKEKEKRMKKEKSHEKVKSTRSTEAQHPLPVQSRPAVMEGNIYDEPGELLASTAASKTQMAADPLYDEAGVGGSPASSLQKPDTSPPSAEGDTYATPSKPKKDAWKQCARPDSDFIHKENYSSIRVAASSAQQQEQSPLQTHVRQMSNPLPSKFDTEEFYDHLGAFDPRMLPNKPENIYGMASAVQTVPCQAPVPAENEYEDTSIAAPVPAPRKVMASRQVRDDYEEPDLREDRSPVEGCDGDYADAV